MFFLHKSVVGMTTVVNQNLQQEVYDRLTYINTNFIEPKLKGHPYFGGAISTTFATTGLAGAEKYVNTLFSGYSNFNAQYGTEINVPTTPLQGNVYIRDVRDTSATSRNPYAVVTLSNVASFCNEKYFYGEANLSKLLTVNSDLLAQMDSVRMLYSLLDPVVYQQYTAFVTTNKSPSATNNFKVHKYSLSADNTTEYVINSKDRLEQMKDLVYSLMTSNNLMRTKDIRVSTSTTASAGAGLLSEVTVLTDAQKIDQGITTTDQVVALSFTGADVPTVTDRETSPVVLTAKAQSGEKLALSFKYKMNAAPNQANVGQMKVIVKNVATGAVLKTVTNPVSTTWQSFQQVVDVPSSTPISVTLVNVVGPSDQSKKKILITDVKATFSADWRVWKDNTVQLPLIQESDIFVVRRLLRLYELMANMLIACASMDKTSKSADSVNLGQLCYTMLIAAMYDTIQDPAGPNNSIKDLTGMLNDRIKTMRDNSKTMDQVDTVVGDLKMSLKTESEKLERRLEKEKKSMAVMYAALSISLIVSIVCMAAFFAPMEKPKKLSIIGMSFAVAILVTVVLNLIYNKQVEGFYAMGLGSSTAAPQRFNSSITANTSSNDFEASSNVALDTAIDFLDNTINVAYMLASYRSYGNVNQIMNREMNIYQNRALQMQQTNLKLSDANNVVTLSQKIQKARISFFTYLAIIISLTVVAVLMLDSVPGASNIVLGVAGVIVFILAVTYFMDTSGRVNTSGEKYYWGQPDVRML